MCRYLGWWGQEPIKTVVQNQKSYAVIGRLTNQQVDES